MALHLIYNFSPQLAGALRGGAAEGIGRNAVRPQVETSPFCVHECFSKLGFLFSAFMPEKSELKLNKNLFVATIKKAVAQTFNENNLLFFKSMLDVLNFLDENSENKEFIYGTQNFHIIWEKMIDCIFGESKKENFYPKVYWKLENGNGSEERYYFKTDEKRNTLRPDTIMITSRGKKGRKFLYLTQNTTATERLA